MKKDKKLLSVVMPVYNERFTLREILRQVRQQEVVKEVIVVDDCSSDGTREILKDLVNSRSFQQEGPPLRLLLMNENSGKGAALQAGFKMATGEFTIVQDADLEYDPNEYEQLLEPAVEGRADVVYGSRFLAKESRVLYFWHSLGNKLLTMLSNLFTNLNLTDMETCYKLFRTEIIQGIPIRENGFGFEPEITAKLAKLRCRIFEVPVSYSGRTYAEGKKIGWQDGVRALWCILKYFFTEDLARESLDWRLIRLLQGAGQYNTWLFNQLSPHLGERILEIGAGFGNFTRFLRDRDGVCASDWDEFFIRELKRTHGSFENISVKKWNPEEHHNSPCEEPPESILYVNGLQKHERDDLVLERCQNILPKGGKFVGVVAADPSLYGSLDESLNHVRRYRRRDLKSLFREAEFELEEIRSLNILGKIGWWINSRLLRSKKLSSRQIRIFDRLIPLLELEESMDLKAGLSYLVVAKSTTPSQLSEPSSITS